MPAEAWKLRVSFGKECEPAGAKGDCEMRLYGYSARERMAPEPQPFYLVEATIAASPEELRSIAAFLVSCAAEMETTETRFDHAHLSDSAPEFRDSPQIVVTQPAP
jgi:hypothetical protein